MDASAQYRAMDLLGRFNDELTRVVDDAFGTEWAEIEEMVAIAALVAEHAVTTRDLATVSGLHRRAVTRMIARLRAAELVFTRPSEHDGRAVDVVLTPRGERRAELLRTSIAEFFVRNRETAHLISQGMHPTGAPRAPSTTADPIDLLRRVCEAGAALVRFMPEEATQGRLAARQRAALVLIATHGAVRPHELVPALGLSRAGVTYVGDQLCAKGFVSRRRDAVPEDKRAVVLEATADGLAAVRAVLDGIDQQREELGRLFTEVARWRDSVVRSGG